MIILSKGGSDRLVESPARQMKRPWQKAEIHWWFSRLQKWIVDCSTDLARTEFCKPEPGRIVSSDGLTHSATAALQKKNTTAINIWYEQLPESLKKKEREREIIWVVPQACCAELVSWNYWMYTTWQAALKHHVLEIELDTHTLQIWFTIPSASTTVESIHL